MVSVFMGITHVTVIVRGVGFLILGLGILHARRNQDFHRDFFVDGADKVTAAAVVEDADDGFLFALHHADDPAFSFAVIAETTHLHQYLVAVHGVADFRRRDKDIALQLALDTRRQGAGFGDDEAIAVAMHTEAAYDEVLIAGGGRKAPALLANGDELAAAGELAQELLQAAAVTAFESQIMDKLFEARHMFGLLGDVMEDLLFRQHARFSCLAIW